MSGYLYGMKKGILTPAFLLLFCGTCLAEGQGGMGTFLLILFLLSLFFYTLIFGLFIRLGVKVFRTQKGFSSKACFGLAFLIALLLLLLGGLEATPLFLFS